MRKAHSGWARRTARHFRRLFERDPPSLNESTTNRRLEADARQRLDQLRGRRCNWKL
jgi:hypothetical protein